MAGTHRLYESELDNSQNAGLILEPNWHTPHKRSRSWPFSGVKRSKSISKDVKDALLERDGLKANLIASMGTQRRLFGWLP